MQKSDDINELAEALSKAQGEMHDAKVDSTNPHFKSDYASLASYLHNIRPIFAKYGLSFSQLPSSDERGPRLTTLVMHKSGQWLSSSLPLSLTKNDMQGLGSALSYARRYMLSALVGLSQEDDDAETAVERPPAVHKFKEPAPAISPPKEPKKSGKTLYDDTPIGTDGAMKLYQNISAKGLWTRDEITTYIKSVLKTENAKDLTWKKAKDFANLTDVRTFQELVRPT